MMMFSRIFERFETDSLRNSLVGRRHGIGDSLTVPARLTGDAHGSVSFAWKPGKLRNTVYGIRATYESDPEIIAADA
jgi:hypothetical protein